MGKGKRMPTLLIVDDESKILSLLREYLGNAGYSVRTATSGQRALAEIDHAPVDLVVLDWMLPDIEGPQVAQAIRQKGNTPIIMLTARSEEADRVVGLEIGADDYVTKPFSPRELLARIKAVLRRSQGGEDVGQQHGLGPFVVDEGTRELLLDGQAVALTATEFDLIVHLIKHPRRVFSRLELLHVLEGHTYAAFERTIDTHIKNLRKKLEPDPQHPKYIQTVHGVGYKFVSPAAP